MRRIAVACIPLLPTFLLLGALRTGALGGGLPSKARCGDGLRAPFELVSEPELLDLLAAALRRGDDATLPGLPRLPRIALGWSSCPFSKPTLGSPFELPWRVAAGYERALVRPLLRGSRLLSGLGVPHGFSTAAVGDVRTALPQRALLLAGAWRGPLATAKQVHGARLLWPAGGGPDPTEADALAARPGLAVGVFTADCVPILLVDPDAGLCAAVHAGWRGTLAELLGGAVRELVRAGAKLATLRAAIGPHIGACCYEVDPALAARFRDRFGARAVQGERALDLGAANRTLLAEAGLAPSQVETLELCTGCFREGAAPGFFSYRRDHEHAGRQLSFVGLPEVTPVARVRVA